MITKAFVLRVPLKARKLERLVRKLPRPRIWSCRDDRLPQLRFHHAILSCNFACPFIHDSTTISPLAFGCHVSSSHPLSKLLPLSPNIHEAWSALQHLEGISHVIFIHLPWAITEALLALPLNFSSPHAPLYRSQFRSSQHQTQADHQRRDNCLNWNVKRQTGDHYRCTRRQSRCERCCARGMECGVLVSRVAAAWHV